MSRISLGLCAGIALTVSSCATQEKTPVQTVRYVDLDRFMGRWYVLASIPTFLERNAYNAIESYSLNADGTIATTFTYHKGAFDGPLKTMKPHGFVEDSSNAVWGMQFIWPIKAEYRIVYLDDAYSQVVVARSARDYVWIMARHPGVSAADYAHLTDIVKGLGYDLEKLRTVPQRWP
jgi:apolipoprotein D and lipocalin family protein